MAGRPAAEPLAPGRRRPAPGSRRGGCVFAGIALLVAALSIHNASAVIAAQRARESALLRAVGASRRQIFAGHLGEAAALGLVASVAGVAAGYGMAAGL
ncbi:MAG TPA: hypothetical protein DHU96_23660 [Actinobacteria bacterium]|nr:hypothetical protein [Actinomycetota bacterium]